jgi:superfamily II DNA/RNA helicase
VHDIHRSNDRPNIHLVVRELKYAANSFLNLAFLIPLSWKAGDPPPPKFLIFFDSIAESILAVEFLRSRLPLKFRDKIKWFNAKMSSQYCENESDKLKAGISWGLGATDSFGMVSTLTTEETNLTSDKTQGLDLSNIMLVIQWRTTCDTCTFWQRIGRAARNPALQATALFFVESKHFDTSKEKAAARKEKAAEKSVEKATGKVNGGRNLNGKRTAEPDSSRPEQMGGERQRVVGSMDPAHITTQRSPVAGPGIGVQAVEIAGPSANPTKKEAAPLTLQKHTERRTLYNTSLAQTTKKGGKRDGEELEAADTPRYACRREIHYFRSHIH